MSSYLDLEVIQSAATPSVTSVSGTTGQIDVLNSTSNPVISLDAAILAKINAAPSSYGVQTISGTTSQIDVTGTATNPIIGLDPNITTSLSAALNGVTGTSGQIDISSTNPNNPVISLDSAILAKINSAGSGSSSIATVANGLINPEMQINQRAQALYTFTASGGAYTLDRMYAYITSSGLSISVSQTPGALSGQQWLRIQRTANNAGSGTASISQTLNQCNSIPFIGQRVTVSFNARAGANYSATNSALNLSLSYGTATSDAGLMAGQANAASATSISTSTFTLTSSSTRFSATFVVPANATQVMPVWTVPSFTGAAGTNDYADITDLKMEVGSQATALVRQSFNQALLDCKLYYRKTYPYSVAPYTTNNYSGAILTVQNQLVYQNYIWYTVQFSSEMVAPPSVAVISIQQAVVTGFTTYNNTSNQDLANGAASVNNISTKGFDIYNGCGGYLFGSSGSTNYWNAFFHYLAISELN